MVVTEDEVIVADITQITSKLWVGSHPSSPDDIRAIVNRGITLAVDVRGQPSACTSGSLRAPGGVPERPEPDHWAGSGASYVYVPACDNGTMIPASTYAQAVDAIESEIQRGGVVLVYCAAGHDRSPSFIYAYLRKTGLSKADAWTQILSVRRGASRQYESSADRYLVTIGIGSTPGATPTPDPVQPVPPGKTPSAPLPPERGVSIVSLFAIGAVLTGVYYLAKSSGPRANPGVGDVEYRPPHLNAWGQSLGPSVVFRTQNVRYLGTWHAPYFVIGKDLPVSPLVEIAVRPDGRLSSVERHGRQIPMHEFLIYEQLWDRLCQGEVLG